MIKERAEIEEIRAKTKAIPIADALTQAERLLSDTCIHCGSDGEKWVGTVFCYDCGETIPVYMSNQYPAYIRNIRKF